MSDDGRNLLTFVVVLLVLPFIVYGLHAPTSAAIMVAVGTWPIAAAVCVMLYVTEKERREQR